MPLRPEVDYWARQVIDHAIARADSQDLTSKIVKLAGVSARIIAHPQDMEMFTQALLSPTTMGSDLWQVIVLTDLPAALWRTSPITYGDLDGRGGVGGSEDGRLAVAWNSGQFILTVMDRDAGLLAYVKQGGFPTSERGGPLRTPAHWLASENGVAFLHAAALSLGGRSVLVGGPSGSGKSTFTTYAVRGGADVIGDDYVSASVGSNPARLFSAYRTIKSWSESPVRGSVASFELGNGKSAQLLESETMEIEAPLLACGIIDTDGPQTPEQADPAWVARTFAASTILQVPLYADFILSSVGRLVSRVPCFRLGRPENPDGAIVSIETMLEV